MLKYILPALFFVSLVNSVDPNLQEARATIVQDSTGLGDICTTNKTCQESVNEYAYCARTSYVARCSCNKFAVQYEDSCYERKYLGDSCNTTLECTMSIYGEVYCDSTSQECACVFGYLPETEEQMCSRSAGKLNAHLWIPILFLFVFNFVQKLCL